MKNLIVYFSWSNTTKNIVEEINKEFSFDIVRIERKIPYSSDYNICAYKEAKEEVDKNIHPEIKALNVDISSYDKILLFFPIWWYTFPMVVGTFIESLKGYKGEVILFENSYTNDKKYQDNSYNDFKKINKEIALRNGLFNKPIEEHIKFIKEMC